MEDRLSRLISEHNLDAHRLRFDEEDIDLRTMAAMVDAEIDRLADAWKLPLGARTRLRALRDHARESVAAISGPEAAPEALSDADRQLVDHLPTPLARAANELLKPVGDRTNNDVQAAVDVLLRSLALVCQSDYFHSAGWYDPEINEMFPSLEQRPSHGTWMRFIALCVKSARRANHSCFLRELPDTWRRCETSRPLKHETSVFDEFGQPVRRGGGIGMLEFLIHHRNSLAHHRLDIRDLGLAARFRERCLDVFREFRWLGRYELWLGSASRAFLLQGTAAREAVAGPTLLTGDRDVALRRPRTSDPKDWEVLPMPPLILSAAAVPGEAREPGTADSEVIIFSELVSRKGGGDQRINYTSDPFAPRHVSIETAHGTNELRRLQDRKSFPRLGRDALDRDDLRRRIRAASERTLRVLESSGKFRRRLHVERAAYEPRLHPWIDSTVPLLGLAAEAGAGKTGILANLASRWIERSAAPVLFLLANQHQAASDLDRILQDALTLGRDVTVGDICARCGGLVILIDGLNEHPGREDLVHRICSLAQLTLEAVNGPRFAVTWRTEDDAWIREASSRRPLWWVPEDVNARIDEEIGSQETGTARAASSADDERKGAPEASSSDRATSPESVPEATERSPPRRTESDDATFIRVGPLTHEECAEAWRRYRNDADLRLHPEFEWDEVRRQSPGLARRLRNPLWMRVLMECMHGKDLPPDLGETDVFSEYLEQIRTDYAACRADRMLEALGRIMLRRRDLRITLEDLERECWELVHPREGQSSLLALERRGILSSIDGRSFTFTVERLAEQVIGEHLAGLPEAESGTALAKLAADLHKSKFSQAHGVVQEALQQRVRSLGPGNGDGFLFEFIDACPVEHADLAAAALERRIVEAGEGLAGHVVERLLEDRTESDLEVAANAARRLIDRGLQDLALAFLAPFVSDERIALMARSIRFRRLLMLYVSCVQSCLAAHGDDEPEWLDVDRVCAVVESLRREDSRSPTSDGKQLLAMALVDLACSKPAARLTENRQLTLHEALDVCRSRVDMAAAAGNPDDVSDARKQLAAYLRLSSDSIEGHGQDGEREKMLLEALAVGYSVGGDDAWDASPVLWDLALLCEQGGQTERAIEYHRRCLAIERKRRRWWHASQTSFRIGGLLFAAGREVDAAHADSRALELAKASGSRHDYATALEWFGDALRKRGRMDAAMDAYQESLRVGAGPPCAEGWSPSSVLAEIARVHSDRGEHAEAVETRRRVIDALRDTEDRRQLVVAIEYLGHALREAGLHREAIEEYLESHRIGMSPEPVERWRPAISLHWAARCHHELGQYGAAVEIRRSAVRAARAADDRHELVNSLDWLARDLRDAGAFEEAALAFGDAFEAGMHPEPLENWSPSGILWRHAVMESDRGNVERAMRLLSHAVNLSRASGDRARISVDLDSLGDLLRKTGRPEDALAHYLEAIDVGMTPEQADDWSPAVALQDAAEVLGELGRWQEAVEYQQRAIEAFETDGDRRALAVGHEFLACALRETGRLEDALVEYLKSHEIGTTPARVADWKPGISLGQAARVLGLLERWDEAAEYRQRAADSFAVDGDRRGAAIEFELLGNALREAGRPEDALHAYRKSHEIGTTPNPVADWAPGVPLAQAARVLGSLERHDESIEHRRRAIDAFAANGDRRRAAIELNLLGNALRGAGRAEEALHACLEAIDTGLMPNRVENWSPATPLSDAARALVDLRRWDEAIDYRRRAIEAFAADGDRRAVTVAHEFLGHALREAGRLEEALAEYLKSHEIGSTPERVADWKPGIPLGQAARVLASLERWDEAVNHRRLAIGAYSEDGDRRGMAIELDLLGDTLRAAGRAEDALRSYLEALDTGMTPCRAEDWSPAVPLHDAANVLASMARWDEAIEYRRRAADAYADDGDRHGVAIELDLLGDALRNVGRHEDALRCHLEALEAGMTPERVDDWTPSIPLHAAANALSSLERWDEAIKYRRRAIEAFAADGDRLCVAVEFEFLADDLRASGCPEDALDAYREAHRTGLTPDPVPGWDSARPLLESARTLEGLRRLDDAIAAFRAAVEDGSCGRGQTGDGRAEATMVAATLGLGALLSEREGYAAALEAMEPGREGVLLIERLPTPDEDGLRKCAGWWDLQSRLLAAIGDRATAAAASDSAAAIRARLTEP